MILQCEKFERLDLQYTALPYAAGMTTTATGEVYTYVREASTQHTSHVVDIQLNPVG